MSRLLTVFATEEYVTHPVSAANNAPFRATYLKNKKKYVYNCVVHKDLVMLKI
jgi:hypothetical protein